MMSDSFPFRSSRNASPRSTAMRTTRWRFVLLAFGALSLSLMAVSSALAGPRISIVVGDKAAALEQRAAAELSETLKPLFEADVSVGSSVPSEPGQIILLGSPQTNPEVKKLAGDSFSKLSDQGHVLRSVKSEGHSVLIVGGNSPVATFWAASELAHHFGVRSLLQRDFLPVERPEAKFDDINLVIEPAVRTRAFQVLDDSPVGFAGWGSSDQRRLLKQLAKLKFNRIVLRLEPEKSRLAPVGRSLNPGNAFAAQLAGFRFPVTGDTPGRAAFQGAKLFENPDFAGRTSSDELRETTVSYLTRLCDSAEKLGLSVSLIIEASEDSARNVLTQESVRLLTERKVDVDVLSSKAAQQPVSITPGGSAPRVLPTLGTAKVNKAVEQIRQSKADSFLVSGTVPGDLNPAVYFAARAGFDPKLTADQALDDLVTPICGVGVVERLRTGFLKVDEADEMIRKNSPDLGTPRPDMLLSHLRDASKHNPLEWFGAVKTRYTDAMNEMYRANTRARDGARPFTLYYAKRFEFGLHYMTCLEAVHKAGLADVGSEDRTAQLEAAVEAMYSALNANAEVARDQSDRGVIAVLNEFGYRPLVKELEASDQ